MKYLEFNDELTNSIHTKRQHDYWDFYLEVFQDQIEQYANEFEWDKAKRACAELNQIADRFPKKWWALGARYRNAAYELRKDIKQLYDLEINVVDEYE